MNAPEPIESEDEFVDRIMAEIVAAERAFAASVQVGDRVSWREWVWAAGITGNPADPDESVYTLFTGTVQEVHRDADWLAVDPATVTPSASEVRQRPRHALPMRAFKVARE